MTEEANQPVSEDVTPLVLQMLGQKEVELQLARRQIGELQQQVESLTRRLLDRKR
jgi:hypothetical protein